MEIKSMKTLEFHKILQMLSTFAKNDTTKDLIQTLAPSADFRVVEQTLAETDAAIQLILQYGTPDLLRIQDIGASCKRLAVGGSLSMSELLNIGALLKSARLLRRYTPEQTGVLSGYIEELTPNKTLEERIFSSILSEEEMADNASAELSSIRRKAKNASNKIRSSLDSMIRSPHYQKFLQDAIVTMRNNRYVVPVKAEYRGEVRGIAHDISSSGGTVFIEPESVVSANNELHELSIKEKAEIEKILAEISAEAGEILEQLQLNFETVIHLDFVLAKAKLALDMKAVCPILNREGKINIKKGRHPLIDRNKIVPIDVNLGIDFDSLIVTGPNTGGKTVVLKTVGLFCLMTQAGLCIPAADESEMPVFSDIFADIGDEQSIEQSLSTFSSHMTNIVHIADKATSNSLVLFDELCSGTDPVEGAALATAILEHMRAAGAKIVATTHYSELKLYALSTEGVENASCEFDVNTLSPTYRLLIGIPGKSNAFAISKRLGLPNQIIERAKEKLSDESIQFEDILSRIEKNRQTAEIKTRETEQMHDEIEKLKAQLEKERDKIERQKDKIYDRAREKAEKIILRAQEETEQMLSELKKAQKSKDEKAALRAMEEIKKELGLKKKRNVSPKKRTSKTPVSNLNINDLKLGADVILLDLGDKGTVLSVNEKEKTAVIQVGIMKITAKIENLALCPEEKGTIPKNYAVSARKSTSGLSSAKQVKTEIDLRGMTLEEALLETDKFLDECSLAGLHTVSIIHGKGTGVLRKGIQDMLRRHPQVSAYRLGKYGEGENGVTIAELK